MKKTALIIAMSLALSITGGTCFANPCSIHANQLDISQTIEINTFTLMDEAVTHNDTVYSFNDGVLTVSGTGIATKEYVSTTDEDSIKKVVIKDGISAIGDYAFENLKNVTEIVIPDSVKQIGLRALSGLNMDKIVIPASVEKFGYNCMENSRINTVTMPGHFSYSVGNLKNNMIYEGSVGHEPKYVYVLLPKTNQLILNSDFDPEVMTFFHRAKKIKLSKNDSKYKVYNGLVYTKNGKKLIFVPASTKHLKVRKACKVISVKSFCYFYEEDESGCIYLYCDKLKSITIPRGLKRFKFDTDAEAENSDIIEDCKWNLKPGKWRGSLLSDLRKLVGDDKWGRMLTKKYHVKATNNMYISYDNVLLKYCGYTAYEGKNGKTCFWGSKNTLKIPKYVKEIASYAFASMDNGQVLKKIILPKNIKIINDYAFSGASNLKTIKNLSCATKIGKYALKGTPLYKESEE